MIGKLQVRHRCKDIFLQCTWQDTKETCTPELFETSRTDAGYCCSFNTLKISEQLYKP